METPQDLLYTIEHEWIRVNGNKGVIGISAFAQDQLGDVVFVEMPAVGAELTQGETFGVVESVKTVSDLYAPVNGKVTAVNKALEENPELVNSSPYGDGWILEIELFVPEKTDHLLKPAQYEEQCGKEGA
ncbi:MAG: glycine cleavage system protein GcvH [Candidatus Nitrohelix vancouverensis]|uniref:Glycine cleavage system H protein n=1 Tax=Candidatus Nitrohelix vancouverensis TaxID=2705534 RepID=A0A7T0C011_9BACT|nr:MAG: glycine cleavage system protein GcvH [Candidatus Nitrohelix vancouverensis]